VVCYFLSVAFCLFGVARVGCVGEEGGRIWGWVAFGEVDWDGVEVDIGHLFHDHIGHYLCHAIPIEFAVRHLWSHRQGIHHLPRLNVKRCFWQRQRLKVASAQV